MCIDNFHSADRMLSLLCTYIHLYLFVVVMFTRESLSHIESKFEFLCFSIWSGRFANLVLHTIYLYADMYEYWHTYKNVYKYKYKHMYTNTSTCTTRLHIFCRYSTHRIYLFYTLQSSIQFTHARVHSQALSYSSLTLRSSLKLYALTHKQPTFTHRTHI